MSETVIIAAVTDTGAIGIEGKLLYSIREDMRRFRSLTMGNPIIMGRKTFESMPSGALPGRRNIVVTRNADFSAPGVETATSLEHAIELTRDADKRFIIGGGQIYAKAMPLATAMELTVITEPQPINADTYFPPIDFTQWHEVSAEGPFTDTATGAVYTFRSFRRN